MGTTISLNLSKQFVLKRFLLDDVERAVSVTAGSEHIRTTLLIPFWPGLCHYPRGFPFYTKSPELTVPWLMMLYAT